MARTDAPTELGSKNSNNLSPVASLLQDVFHLPRYKGTHYLQWQYRMAPEGNEIACNLWLENECTAHYCLLPQYWAVDGRSMPFALSLNTAVSEKARGKGVFTSLAERTFEVAEKQNNKVAVVGVANANSTPGFLKKLGFHLVAPLPVRIGLALPYRGKKVASLLIKKGSVPSEAYAQLKELNFQLPTSGWSREWTLDRLIHRLHSPIGNYWLHYSTSGLLVSTIDHFGPLPITILLRYFPAAMQSKDVIKPNINDLIRSACYATRSPFYLHAGFPGFKLKNVINVPRQFLPSPLNLIYRPLNSAAPLARDFSVSVFEFLDFDAY